MTNRPDYKSHPLWNEAMALTRDAYAIAERTARTLPEISRGLRKAAVSVPAHVAGALGADPRERAEHMAAAREALREMARQVAGTSPQGWEDLSRRARELDRAILFEFGAHEVMS